MVIASGKLKDRLYIDLPDIKAESDKLDHLIENHSLSEAWELFNKWVMTHKRYEAISFAGVPSENIGEYQQVKQEHLSVLCDLTNCLKSKMDMITPADYREAKRQNLKSHWGTDRNFLEFTEAKLKVLGREYAEVETEARKAQISFAMVDLIKNLNDYFNVYEYNDLFNIPEEATRLKIAELHRYYFDSSGIDYLNRTNRKNLIDREFSNLRTEDIDKSLINLL